MLVDAPSTIDVISRFLDFVGDSIILGYNVSFDIRFLYDNCMRYLNRPFTNDYFDIMRLARKIYPDLSHYRLYDLLKIYGLINEKEHRALSDCEATYYVYQRLHNEALSRFGTDAAICSSLYPHNSHHSKSKASDIIANSSKANPDCPIYGVHCVITGKLERFTRAEAMQLIADLGGINDNSVTKRTNLLILGNNDYCSTIKDGKSSKQKKAEAYRLSGQDIAIIPENEFYDMIAEYVDEMTDIPGKDNTMDEGQTSSNDIPSEQLSFTLSSADYPLFGRPNYETIYSVIQDMIGHDDENVCLKLLKNNAAIYMFGTNAFTININRRNGWIRTTSHAALNNSNTIDCATITEKTMTIPLTCGLQYYDNIKKIVIDIYEEKKKSAKSDMIGCCDMFVMCSDALMCLRRNDPHYNDCLYRKNLEAGRIFYGKNKNI